MKTDELLRRIKVILEENDKETYSHKEAAEFLGVSTSYLEKLKSNYLIKFCRLGGKIVYRKTHLLEYLDRVTVRGPENDPGRQGVSYVRGGTVCGATQGMGGTESGPGCAVEHSDNELGSLVHVGGEERDPTT